MPWFGRYYRTCVDPFCEPDAFFFAPPGACIEENNCDWEKATVCAFSNITTADQVSFLACMDEEKTTAPSSRRLLGGGGGGGDAVKAAKACAGPSKVDTSALMTCYNGGEGESLLETAAKAWIKTGYDSVPHTNVQGKTLDADYAKLARALCKAGSTAKHCQKRVSCKA